MQFFNLVSAAALLVVASATVIPSLDVPSELIERQSNTAPIDTSTLFLGACLAIGTCYYNGTSTGCLTHGCSTNTALGEICSCNADVQNAIDVQNAKGKKMWPVKCPY